MNNQEQNQEQKVESGVKTAHVAGKSAATVAGTAVGGAVGGKVAGKVYDIASKTKLGNAIEQNLGTNLARSPIGNLNKKLDDAGMIDAASGAVNRLGSNKKNAQRLGQNNKNFPKRENQLGTNSASNNGESEVPNALKNPNHYQGISSRNITSFTSQSEEESDSSDDSVDGVTEETTEEKQTFSFRIKKFLIPIILISAGIGLIILVLIIQVLLNPIESILSIFSLNSWDSDNKTYVYENGTSKFANEEYNNFIKGSSDGSQKGLIQEFQEKFGVSIDWVMLDVVLEYQHLLSDDKGFYGETDNFPITASEIKTKLNEFGDLDGITGINDSDPSKLLIIYVARFMLDNNDGDYTSDVSKNGPFYNKLIDSWFLTAYYGSNLKDTEYETRKELVDQIYTQYDFAKEALLGGNAYGVISSKIQVYLQTCEYPYSTMINERGKKVFSNDRNINKGTSYPQSFSLTDYLKGAVEGELGRNSLKAETREGVKAFVIATLSYTLRSFYVDFYPGLQSFNFPSGNCRLVSCDVTNGCSYTTNGMRYGTAYSGTTRGGGIHEPWNAEQNAYMDEVLNEVFGIVMVKKGVTADTFKGGSDLTGGSYYSNLSYCHSKNNCMGQKEALQDSRNGMNYVEILNKYYSNFDLINIKEGLYVENVDYSNATYDGNVIFYDQGDYKSSFCGRSTSIASAGCGVTSTAIVISSLTGDKQYDPVYFSNMAKSTHDCGPGISGTNASFFKKAADKFNFGYEYVSKSNAARVIDILKGGNAMVIAHMGQGHFTNGGHYIVLSGVNEQGQVYVYDPNNRGNKRNKGTGNGWYNFNDIVVKEVKSGFYAIIKR